MTTIAGISTGAGCWLAGDSAVTTEDGLVTIQRAPKVWRLGGLIMGASGGAPFYSRLQHLKIRDTRNPEVWGAELAEACSSMDPDDGEALIGCGGVLWYFTPGARPWAAAGAWGAVGNGYLAAAAVLRLATRRGVRRALGWTHKDALTEALEQAAALTTDTREPFRYLEW